MEHLNIKAIKLIKTTKNRANYFLKFILLLASLQLFTNNTHAQTNACGCTPITTTDIFIYVASCTPNTCFPNTTFTGCNCGDPESYIILEYTKVTCGTDIGIMLSKETYIGPNYNTLPSGPPYMPGNSTYNIGHDIILARQALVESFGLTTHTWVPNNFSFVYPAGCKALTQTIYPSPAKCYNFFGEGPNAGQVSSIVDLSQYPVTEMVNCPGDNCCKLNYTYDPMTNKTKFANFEQTINCEGQVPTIQNTKDYICQDEYGMTVVYTGQVQVIGDCKSYCNADMSLLFKTSGTKDFIPLPSPLDFKILPIPAKDFITFSTSENIWKIEIYSTEGKLLEKKVELKNNSMDISKMATGIYYVRVYFNDASVRSIKIIKE